MKIGIVSNLYPPFERGGAELVAQRVADELYRRGHKVFVLSTKPFDGIQSLKLTMTAQHVGRVYRFFPKNLYHLSNGHKKPFPIRLLWHVIDAISKSSVKIIEELIDIEQPDVILTHNLKGLGLAASAAIQKSGVFQLHTLHDVQLTIPSGLLIHGQENTWMNRSIIRRFYESYTKKSIGKPNVVVSPSQYLKNVYSDRGFFKGSDIQVLPNPFPKRHALKRESSRTGPFNMLFIGQLEKHKGIELLLDAVQQLDVPFQLHIAGDGSLATHVADYASRDRRMHFHGFISFEHISKLVSRADVVVVPSLCYENSPTVIYESFQVGVPVIASNIGGIPELIKEGENGWLVEPGNQEALVNALRNVEQNKEELWKLSSSIREGAQKYALRTYVDQLEKMFTQKS